MTLTVPFPAEDAATFHVGQTAQVTLDGSFETLTGTVQSISGGMPSEPATPLPEM